MSLYVVKWRHRYEVYLTARGTSRYQKDAERFETRAAAETALVDALARMRVGRSARVVELTPRGTANALAHWRSRAAKAEGQLGDALRVKFRIKAYLFCMRERPQRMEEAKRKLKDAIDAFERTWAPEEAGRFDTVIAALLAEDRGAA